MAYGMNGADPMVAQMGHLEGELQTVTTALEEARQRLAHAEPGAVRRR